MITWGLIYWPIALVVVSVLFLPAELIALFTNTANTLSDYSWYKLGIHPHQGVHTLAGIASFVAWILFVIVITGHIWFRTPG